MFKFVLKNNIKKNITKEIIVFCLLFAFLTGCSQPKNIKEPQTITNENTVQPAQEAEEKTIRII
ncbi:MAG: hypothetical protein HFH68_04760 [Lachnospiraceae bacterium]|nr:hypothetical protein [Lachnospiraceae bacterium]